MNPSSWVGVLVLNNSETMMWSTYIKSWFKGIEGLFTLAIFVRSLSSILVRRVRSLDKNWVICFWVRQIVVLNINQMIWRIISNIYLELFVHLWVCQLSCVRRVLLGLWISRSQIIFVLSIFILLSSI